MRYSETIARAIYCTTCEQSGRDTAQQPPCKILHDLRKERERNSETTTVQNIARPVSRAGEERRNKLPCKILHDLRAERKRDSETITRAKYCKHYVISASESEPAESRLEVKFVSRLTNFPQGTYCLLSYRERKSRAIFCTAICFTVFSCSCYKACNILHGGCSAFSRPFHL